MVLIFSTNDQANGRRCVAKEFRFEAGAPNGFHPERVTFVQEFRAVELLQKHSRLVCIQYGSRAVREYTV